MRYSGGVRGPSPTYTVILNLSKFSDPRGNPLLKELIEANMVARLKIFLRGLTHTVKQIFLEFTVRISQEGRSASKKIKIENSS